MVNSPSLFPTIASVEQEELNFFVYWRKPNGWVIAGPGWPQEYAKRIRHGWQHLGAYGSFVPGHLSRDTRGAAFSAAREGWRVGFQTDSDGFAKEFPVEQIIAYGWHITPPYREVKFPQLDGIEIETFECPECVRLPFSLASSLATHLRIGHDYSRTDLTEYGREMDIDFTQKGSREQERELREIAQRNLAEAGLTLSNEFVCDVPGCGWAVPEVKTNKKQSLAAHKRFKHERARVPDEESAPEGSEHYGDASVLRPVEV